MPDKKTFFEKIKIRWQDNKILATGVFFVLALVATIKSYEVIANFAGGFVDRTATIQLFNENVQPIYFTGRQATLVGDDCSPIDQISAAILEIQPKFVIIRSHTSKVTVGRNRDLTLERGTLIANELHARMGPAFGGRIVVVSYGGSKTSEAEGDYRERVEVSLSNASDVLAGSVVLSEKIPAQGSMVLSSEPKSISPCFVTAS